MPAALSRRLSLAYSELLASSAPPLSPRIAAWFHPRVPAHVLFHRFDWFINFRILQKLPVQALLFLILKLKYQIVSHTRPWVHVRDFSIERDERVADINMMREIIKNTHYKFRWELCYLIIANWSCMFFRWRWGTSHNREKSSSCFFRFAVSKLGILNCLTLTLKKRIQSITRLLIRCCVRSASLPLETDFIVQNYRLIFCPVLFWSSSLYFSAIKPQS